MSLIPHIRRDAVTWTALGLVVAAILIVTTHHGVDQYHSHSALPHSGATSSKPANRATLTRARPLRSSSHKPPSHSALSHTTSLDSPENPTVVTTQPSAPPTTTTTLALSQSGSIDASGLLAYPNDVSSSYPFRIVTGRVTATLTWRTGSALGLSLSCRGTSLTQSSTFGLVELNTEAKSGECRVNVSRADEDGHDMRYTLSIRYLAPAISSP